MSSPVSWSLPSPGQVVAADDSAIVGRNETMRNLFETARRVAAGDAKILITGESGVGKDVIARYVHGHSARASRAYVAVNCAALSETLLESELFGHAKGSFTGAYRDKVGKLKLADRGTIFLDEVGEMTLRMQALLLRFLENGEIQPVGADHVLTRVDVRVIAATNRDLSEAVAAGRFRADLMYRLDVIHLHVPPLRDRRDDIRPLIGHFSARAGRPMVFSDAAAAALEQYRWPGNIRELQNIVEQLAWVATGDVVQIEDLPQNIRAAGAGRAVPVRERRRQLADELFEELVRGHFRFWDHIHPLFLDRDITRHDLRDLVRRGLTATRGNYRLMVRLFGMPDSDYKRLLNFLATHDCMIDFREFRNVSADSVDPAPEPEAASSTMIRRRTVRDAVASHDYAPAPLSPVFPHDVPDSSARSARRRASVD